MPTTNPLGGGLAPMTIKQYGPTKITPTWKVNMWAKGLDGESILNDVTKWLGLGSSVLSMAQDWQAKKAGVASASLTSQQQQHKINPLLLFGVLGFLLIMLIKR